MKACVIVHEDRAESPELEAVRDAARAHAVTLDERVATPAMDGSRLAREAAAEKFDVVIAAGGDGTLNAVVNGLAGSGIPLGIIPLGTANDFAGQAGIPDDPRDALELIFSTEPVRIDTASLNDRHFLNVSTGGIGAETTAETPDDLKALLGPMAYAITGIRKLTSLDPMQIVIEAQEKRLACDAILFAVGNARSTGGGNLITPQASVTDGLLDVCVVEQMPVTSLLALLPKLRNGTHVEEDGVHYFRTAEVTVTSGSPVSVNVDGEPLSARKMTYRAHPSNLSIHLGSRPGERYL